MAAVPITGMVEPPTPLGQYLALEMTISDTTTTFKLTGPSFSWFAFGFDTDTMAGYTLIIEGTDANRTATEYQMVGRGNVGAPLPTQSIQLVDSFHDSVNDLSTVVLTRPSQTGDPDSADFTTSMTSLDLIWAYDPDASPEFPSPHAVSWHGFDGRGFANITFAPIPEPNTLALVAMATSSVLLFPRRQRR